MLQPRLIPSLLLSNRALVKTVNFSSPVYIGDPLNAVRIFNEKAADELCLFDIDSTVLKTEPNYDLISKIANQCRMPLCYGGGIKSTMQVEKIIDLGVEKVSISSAAVNTPNLINEAAKRLGSQSVVVTVDIKKSPFLKKYTVVTHNAKKVSKLDPIEFILNMQERGVGEIILNSVDKDGTKSGYDIDLVSKLIGHVHVPLTVLGGAGNLTDFEKLWREFGIIGAAAGSNFVFKGKLNAVLINYPALEEKKELIKMSGFK